MAVAVGRAAVDQREMAPVGREGQLPHCLQRLGDRFRAAPVLDQIGLAAEHIGEPLARSRHPGGLGDALRPGIGGRLAGMAGEPPLLAGHRRIDPQVAEAASLVVPQERDLGAVGRPDIALGRGADDARDRIEHVDRQRLGCLRQGLRGRGRRPCRGDERYRCRSDRQGSPVYSDFHDLGLPCPSACVRRAHASPVISAACPSARARECASGSPDRDSSGPRDRRRTHPCGPFPATATARRARRRRAPRPRAAG